MSREYTPLVIAKSFTKQYYEIIHKKPQQLYRFYKDESNFFHGEENQSTETISGSDNIREKVEQLNLAGARVDLSEGSIDAQHSDNNAVFLVVTGKFTMPGKNPRPFVQSFFLVCQNGGKNDAQPSYYVRNSVFRLHGEENVPVSLTPAPPADLVTTAVFEKKEDVVQEKEEPVVESTPELSSEKDDKVNVEASSSSSEQELDVSTVTSEPDYVNVTVKKQDEPAGSDENVAENEKPEPTPEPVVKEKVKPASWACLVAGSSTPEPEQIQTTKPKKVVPKKEPETEKSSPKTTGALPLTVYLCQLPTDVSEGEIRLLFETFGEIKKVDIHSQKGYAFVDFMEASSVKNAIAKKGTGYFTIRDTPIQVEERQTKGAGAKNNNNRGGRGGNSGGNRQNNQNKSGNDKTGSKGGNNSNHKNNNRNTGGKAGNSKQSK